MSAVQSEVRASSNALGPPMPKPDIEEIRRAIAVLHDPDAIIELRALHKQRKRVDAGCYDGAHRDELANEAARLNTKGAAVYVTMNELDPQLLARYANRVQEYAQATATDSNVTRRRWLLVDVDPQRPKDTSATPQQVERANAKAQEVYRFLDVEGWPAPVIAESGNGFHLLYRIDLPNDLASTEVIKHGLEALAARFDDNDTKIDKAVFNPSRIIKLHGTIANKGDHVGGAPWRVSRLVSVPDKIRPVPMQLLSALAAEVRELKPNDKPSFRQGPEWKPWDESKMAEFLARGNIASTGPEHYDGALRWKLKECPFNPDHGPGESAVFLRPDGRLGFECRHNSCQDKHWRNLRSLVDGERMHPHNWPAGSSAGFVGTPLGASAACEWPKPRPLADALPSVEDFPPALLPAALRDWVVDVSARTQAPMEYVAVSAMVSLGAALGRKIAMRPKRRDNWQEFGNLWGAVIGPPSWMKSPALDEGRRHLMVIETRQLEAYELIRSDWEAECEAAKALRDGARDNARNAARKGEKFDRDKLVVKIPDEPMPPRLIVNDATVPALCDVLRANPNGVLIYRDELAGLIAELDQEGMEGSRAFYLTGWSGKDGHVQDRVGRGTNLRVPHVCLSLLGGIQPAKVAPLLRETIATGGGDGFLARFSLIVWPNNPGEYRAIDRTPNAEASIKARAVYARLHGLRPEDVCAEIEDGSPPFLRLDSEAAELFTDWDVELRNRLRADTEDAALAAHLGKYPKAVCGLALLSHLADGGSGPIVVPAVERALAWAELLESHARRAYACLGQASIVAARSLLSKLKRGALSTPFRIREVYQKGWAHLSEPDSARAAVAVLESAGWIKPEHQAPGEEGGRPGVVYHVHPEVQA